MDQPVMVSSRRAMARAAVTMVKWASVGDVAFQPDQLFRSGQRVLVEDSGAFAGGHEPWVAGGLLTGHDGPGLVLLRGEGSAVVECTFMAVVPYSPPRIRPRTRRRLPPGCGRT